LYLTTGVPAVSFGVPTFGAGVTYAIYGIGTPLTVSVADGFGNNLLFGALTAPAVTVTAPAGIGAWDQGTVVALNPITCVNLGVSCAGGNAGQFLFPYAQTYTYGTTTVLQATITGSYNAVPFSVAATSGNIVTGTQAAALTLAVTGTPTYGVGTTVSLKVTQGGGSTQPGVPVTFNLCPHTSATGCTSATASYGGSFSSGAQTGFIVATSGATGTASATYTLPSVLAQVGSFNATIPAPTGATPTPIFTSNILALAATVAGPAVGFKVNVQFSDLSAVKSSLVAPQIAYVYVSLVDQYGNGALNTGITQMQVALSTTVGSLYATTLYIASLDGATNGPHSFGADQWTVPATAVGTVITLTASGPLTTGTKSITIVTPIPTINLKSGSLNGKVIATGTTIYSPSGALTFYSKANASAGYTATTQIATIGTKIGSSPWVTTLTPNVSPSANTFSLFFPAGLSTLNVNASDNVLAAGAKFGNTATTGPYNILVDPYLPTLTIGTPVAGSGSDTVTVTSTEGDFNTTTFAATYGGNAVPASSISWSGTQTLGVSSTLTATISGLVAGTNTLAVSGKTLAGLSGSASASITITVVFANSITFNTGTATYGLNGAFKGITISVTNGWNTAQTIVVYATFKSGSSIYVADGTVTVGAGATASVFCLDLQTIPAGTYSVTFGAVTTANQAVSAPTTAINVVAT